MRVLQKNNTNTKVYMPNYTEPNFTRAMELMLKSHALDFILLPCAFGKPHQEQRWHMSLPDIPADLWRKRNFRLVVHAQDFVHFYGNLCVELHWLEQQFTPEQQQKVIFVCWDHRLGDIYEGNIKVVNFASHSYELVLNLKNRWNEWKDVACKDIKYNWMCLNGRTREYRQEVYNLLRHEPSGFVSHSIFNPIKIHPYQDYDFDNVNNFVKLLPLYQQSRTSIITESLYQDVGGIVTEKTLLAIAAQQPFMCIGHRYCHEDVASLGFQNFNEVFDLSYDSEPKDTRMWSAIEKNIERLRNPIDLDAVKEKTQANFEWLMGDYADSIVLRAKEDLRKIFEKGF